MSEETEDSGEDFTEAAAQADDGVTEPTEAGRQVPLDALQAERAERQRLKDEVRMLKDHMGLLHAQQQQQSAPRQKDEIDSLSDDDVLTVGDARKLYGKLDSQYQMSIQELRMTQKYPDYHDTVTKYLPDVLKNNPSLRGTLQESKDYELAYYLAKNSDAYRGGQKSSSKNADAERIVQNAQRAGSLSSVGKTSPINEARRYRDMSDSEFKQQVQKNLGYT